MNDFLIENFTKAPRGKKAIASQIGLCFIIASDILSQEIKLMACLLSADITLSAYKKHKYHSDNNNTSCNKKQAPAIVPPKIFA